MADPLSDLAADLAIFVVSIRSEAPVWGGNDCGHFVTRWAARCMGFAPPRHGLFDDADSFAAWIEGEGGMLAYAGRWLGGIGCRVVSEPACGDIGLVRVAGIETMAIKAASRGWFMRAGMARAIQRAPADPVQVWRLPCHS